MQEAKRCPTLGECIFYDAPGADQATVELQDALEVLTPDWRLEKVRPLWPKDDFFQDCLSNPYLEDYGDIPLGCMIQLYAAFDALVEEHWRSTYSTTFNDMCSFEPEVNLFGECISSAGSLIPACMMAEAHLQPTGHRADDHAARQDYADSQDSIQNMGDFWKSFYAKESGKKIKDSHISRIADNPNKVGFTKSAIFHKVPLSEQLANSWASLRGKENKEAAVRVSMELNVQKYTVRMPDAVRTSAGPLYIDWVTLPRMSENTVRKIAEAGWNNANICGVDLGMKSHVAVGTQVRAIISIIDGACTDLPTATMCAFEINLASQNNRSLNLPLINLPFSTFSNDLYYFQNRIKIACQFRDPEGFTPATPMFSFSSLEFSEMTQTAFERDSLIRDSWSEIEKRACHGGGRCVASQGVVQTWEKEVNPPLKEYPALVLPPPPVPMRNFIDAESGGVVKGALSKARSMRFQSPHDLWSRPSVDGGSTSALPAQDKLRCSNVPACAYEVDPLHLLYFKNVNVPKDALEGHLLARLDIRAGAQALGSAGWINWVKEGALRPKLTLKFTAASSMFSGISLGAALDVYTRVDPKRTTGLTASLLTGLPLNIWHTRDTAESVWDLDLEEICGHTLYALDDSMGKLDLIIFVARGNELVSVSDWSIHVSCYCDWQQAPMLTMARPYLSWPPKPEMCKSFREIHGPFGFKLDGTNSIKVLDFFPGADIISGTRSVRTCDRTIAAHFRSWAGKVSVSVEVVSSAFITASFIIGSAWKDNPDVEELRTRPHWFVDSGESVDVSIYGPYGEHPTFPGVNAGTPKLVVALVGGVCGPKDTVGTFGFFVRINGIDGIYRNPVFMFNQPDKRFLWFKVTDIRKDALNFSIPGRIMDLDSKTGEYTVTNYVNPASSLFSTAGMHGGAIRLHITWSPLGKMGDMEGVLRYGENLYYSKDEFFWGDSACRGIVDQEGFSHDLSIGNFFGATRPRNALDVTHLGLYSAKGQKIYEIRVSYSILHMDFYGKSVYIRDTPVK
nr:polyprotein 2 [Nepovirus sp.]